MAAASRVEETLAEAGTSRLGIRGMRERVTMLGGSLEIESSLDAGTTLFVRIPHAHLPADSGDGGDRP